jgi:chitosanase
LLSGIGEKAWISGYVNQRRDWLASHSTVILRKTVYRMDAFTQLISAGNWDLALPCTVRGVLIEPEGLDGEPHVRVSAEGQDDRLLMLRNPVLTGPDVLAVQKALRAAGLAPDSENGFGPQTDKAVRSFQRQRGLRVDGIVGPGTRTALGL